MKIYILSIKYIKRKILFLVFLVLSLAIALLGVAIPYITGTFIDFLVYLKNRDDLIRYGLVYSLICILSILINFVLSRINIMLLRDSVYRMQLDSIRSLEKSYILKTRYDSSAELSQKLSFDSNSMMKFF